MERSSFGLFIKSRKLTSYPWKACQRDIRFNFRIKGSGGRRGICSARSVFFCGVLISARQPGGGRLAGLTGSQRNSGEARPTAKRCLMASSCSYVSSDQNICPEQTNPYAPPRSACQSSASRCVTDARPRRVCALWEKQGWRRVYF